jgi:amidohydrolase
MEFIKARMQEVLSGVCGSTGASCELEYEQGYIPLVNDRGMTDFAASVIKDYMGERAWAPELPQTMGGEDFAFYLQKVPGALLRLGLGEDHAGLHESGFDFADEALESGILALTALALETLARDQTAPLPV